MRPTTRRARRLITLLATTAVAVPVTVTAAGADASASSFTTSVKHAIIRAGPLPRLGHLAVAHRALPDAVLHQAYSFRFRAQHAGARVSWSAVGPLPPGLSLDPGTGTLSGVPDAAGSSDVVVRGYARGRQGAVGYANAVLTVERPVITNVAEQPVPGARPVVRIWGSGFGVIPAGRAGQAVQSWTDHEIVATPGSGRGSIIADSGRLTVPSDGARWAGHVTAWPADGAREILALPPRALQASTGVPYQVTLAAAGGSPTDSWSIVAGRLPAGLTLGQSSGVISGTPVSAGRATLTVQAAGPGADAARARLTVAVSDQVTVPEPTVASSLYQGLYFGQLGSSTQLESLLLADVATDTYAANPAADSGAVQTELAALKSAFDNAANPVVTGTGTGLASFGPNLVPQLTGALSVMTTFATSSQATVIGSGVLGAAQSIYSQYLQSNLADAIGYGQGYNGFSDRTVYDTGDAAGSAFHAAVSAPVIAQAVSCGQSSAGCATVIDSLLEPVTGVSVTATPAQMQSADPSLTSTLQGLGITVNSDGTITMSASDYDSALNAAAAQATTTVQTESADDAQLIADTGPDPAAPNDPSATAAASASFIAATLPDLDLTLSSSTILAALGNTVDPQSANSSFSTLLSGATIAQGTGWLLKALGSNNTTQDNEIAGTFATLFDICTGNFADAIKQVFSLLSGGSGQPDETFQLAQQIEGMITNVYQNLSAQIKEVQSSLTAIQSELGNLYQTMIADFALINFQLDTVSSSLSSAILQLGQLQYSVDITDFDLLNISSADVNGKIQADFNSCLDYASRFPGLPGLTASAFQACEGDFKTDATSVGVASNPAVEYQIPGPYDNATIAGNLTPGYDLPSNLLYLLTILNNRWPADATAPPAGLVNPDVWAEAALGYRELLDENLKYSAGPEPDLAAVELPGQQAAAAISALQAVQNGQAPVINDVTGNYNTALTTLVNDVTTTQGNFPTQNQYPPYGNWQGYSASAGPEQTPAGGIGSVDPQQQTSSMPACGTTTTDATFTAQPWETGVSLPNSWFLLYQLGNQANGGFSPTTTPLCVASFTAKQHITCIKGNCQISYTESGSLSVQFEGTDGALHTMDTLTTPTTTCIEGAAGCDTVGGYFATEIGEAGSVAQFLANIGGHTTPPDTSVLDSEGAQILAAEQLKVYQWDADNFTNTGLPSYNTLTGDMKSLAGAFELLQATAQTVAPSASLSNQALCDILYGTDQLASYTGAPNTPVAILQALASGTGTTTLADWQNTQSGRLSLAQTLLNGYLSSASSAGNVATAEAPDLTYGVLDQLNTGLQLGLNQPPAITAPTKVGYTLGQKVKLVIHSSGYPVPKLTWTGQLPAGLKVTKGSGKLTITGTIGSTATTGKYQVTVTATSSTGQATKTITISVKE
jgi:hypothetical protein